MPAILEKYDQHQFQEEMYPKRCKVPRVSFFPCMFVLHVSVEFEFFLCLIPGGPLAVLADVRESPLTDVTFESFVSTLPWFLIGSWLFLDKFPFSPFLQTCAHIVLLGSSRFPMLSVDVPCTFAFSLGREGLTFDRFELY
jgi:hypothetical protein